MRQLIFFKVSDGANDSNAVFYKSIRKTRPFRSKDTMTATFQLLVTLSLLLLSIGLLPVKTASFADSRASVALYLVLWPLFF